MRKILIVDSMPVILDALTQALSTQYQVISCDDGEQLLTLLMEFRPDLLVIDLSMPGVDGIGILKTAFMAGIRPKILASTRFGSDYVTDALTQLNASYLLTRPCSSKSMLERIMDIELRLDSGEDADIRRIANDLLLQLGLRMDLQGYRYILEAIIYACLNMDCTMTGELYPYVAERCNGNPQQVERAIRSCIQKAWQNRNEQIWGLYFPKDKNGKTAHLNNGAFLKRAAYAVNDFYAYSKKHDEYTIYSGCR